ncbi:acetylhydrolase [Polymorphobacter multimanifer]|uniref:alpha/beta hydrolase n=1 Tax=Polymorphobacter multimanifer TaxID=1070431 RepID=UPI00166393B2|nr:alpha/beta hydrolase [Polymorphobacter multimanifer]GGI88675.1 acetylhydrolase [Polymorphobacter multimanifer]
MTTPSVRPDVQMLLGMLASQPGPPMHELDAATARDMYNAMAQMADSPRGELAEVKELTIAGDAGAIPARLYRPTDATHPAPVLLFFHGGGWVIGNLDTHDSACAAIARGLGLSVVSVDYRLAPEHRFPAAVDDCLAAARWLATSPAEIGHPVSGLIPAGDSAGGTLAAITSQQLAGQLPVSIVAQWLIYPGTDMQASSGSMEDFADGYLLTRETMDWFMNHYFEGGDDRTDPRASPLAAESLKGQPPTLVFTCSLDPLRDQGRAYAARLIEAGVPTIFREAEGQIHGSLTLRAGIPSAQADLDGNLAALRLLLTA